MIENICRLCKRKRDLRESHLLPRALYRYLRHDAAGRLSKKEPVRIRHDVALRTSKQIKDYLLCEECELRFSRLGEQYVLNLCFHHPGQFPLQSILSSAPLQQELETGWVLETATVPRIEPNRLAYFAMSVFWRAAVHSWDVEGHTAERIKLGSVYEEKARRYLLGETELPNEMVVLVKVASSQAPITQVIHFPRTRRTRPTSDGLYHYHQFAIPGIAFDLLVGSRIPNQARKQGCILRGTGNPIFLFKSETFFWSGVLNLLKTAKPARGLLKEFLPDKLFHG